MISHYKCSSVLRIIGVYNGSVVVDNCSVSTSMGQHKLSYMGTGSVCCNAGVKLVNDVCLHAKLFVMYSSPIRFRMRHFSHCTSSRL